MLLLFVMFRLYLSVPLRSQWGDYQLTYMFLANLSSIVTVAGACAPLLFSCRRQSGLTLLGFTRTYGHYLLISHALIILLAIFTGETICKSRSVQIQDAALLVFVVACQFSFFLTTKCYTNRTQDKDNKG